MGSDLIEWRSVPSIPAVEVSEFGDLRTKTTRRVRRGFIDRDGYVRYCVTMCDGKKTQRTAHRLVAIAFHGEPRCDKMHAAHIDGSKLNNHHSNIKWATPRENIHDRDKHGLGVKGDRNGRALLTENDVRNIRRRLMPNSSGKNSAKSIALEYDVSVSQVHSVYRGKTWKHLPMESENV